MKEKMKISRIIPAVDIRGGRCVRLLQGDYSKETVYSDDPVCAVAAWDQPGIDVIHVVDLDGAKEGRPVNLHIVAKIAKALKTRIEVGGGVRTENDAESLLSAGASRVILGTSICENPEKAETFVKRFGPDRIVAGIDAKNGVVATRGWISSSGADALSLAAKFADAGIIRIIYTDISTDGMLCGPNISAVRKLCEALPGVEVISSGGISSLDDIRRLFKSPPPNLEAAIIGKALYEAKFGVDEALAAAG